VTTAGPLAAIVAADDYLDRWAARLGVGDQLAAARRAASTD
jgi:predicted DNA-binding protein (UPF0278 family)